MPARVARRLAAARERLIRLEGALAGISLLLIILLSLGQIGARNFFDTGLPAAATLVRHLVLYVLFLGAVLAVEQQRHIKIDALAAWLPETWNRHLARPLNLLAAVVCALFTRAAVRFWADAWHYAEPGQHWATALDLIIPVGFGLLSLHFLLHTLLGPRQSGGDHL